MSQSLQPLEGLFNFSECADRIPWQPFREGVEIHRIYGDGINGPAAALLRYRERAAVPLHEHTGFEHIIILSGSQEDCRGKFGAGTLIINLPGSQHRVFSEEGCVVLAIYEKPVHFIGKPPRGT
jgi:anti-sigma factor ChrR (cupin superfamily)